MNISNDLLSVSIDAGKLRIINKSKKKTLVLNWPAVAVSISGREITPSDNAVKSVVSKETFSQSFEKDGILFTVKITLSENPWFTKSVLISAKGEHPTPDYVIVDRQMLPKDGLRLCGYKATKFLKAKKAEEEGAGIIPGCGYPLIGKNFFMGLEHPAAFNELEKKNGMEAICLKHYPVWEGGKLQVVNEVFGWTDEPGKAFGDYLDTIRIPALKKPFVSFCTFWSDPYLGNYEYDVSLDAYEAFFRAFEKHGLIPDAFTLDAGWNDRRSIFQAKEKVGGDKGLVKLRKLAEKMGSSLSLWLSHNGYMGIDKNHMRKIGFEVGAGDSSAYCGDGYGVMMDKRFAETLGKRFCELVGKVGISHFKIDWDNDCATNLSFNNTYPTRNHVRQASLNAFFEIAREFRKLRKSIIIRNGWWPSPWWLSEANHVWLADSGDSEYASLPSKTQRDSASTHRDLMYYNILRRDGSALYLDCFDNHEFPDAFRNPFMEEPVSWINAVWLSFMRGSTYLAYTLQPESLEDWQVDSLKRIMEFCRIYSAKIFTSRGQMVLGDPGLGEIYGFYQPSANESWCTLRNPLPIPQKIKLNPNDFSSHKVSSVSQFYPHYETINFEDEMTFLAHELKILIFSSEKVMPAFPVPYMAVRKGKDYRYAFPASESVSREIRPMSAPMHQIKKMCASGFGKEIIGGGIQYNWLLTVPYRMRDMEMQFAISRENDANLKISAFTSRAKEFGSTYAVPVTEIKTGLPGYGEAKNPGASYAGNLTYYYMRIPAGGQFSLFLRVEGVSGSWDLRAVWLAGYEAPSRKFLSQAKHPIGFAKYLPCQHPLGFGRAVEISPDSFSFK